MYVMSQAQFSTPIEEGVRNGTVSDRRSPVVKLITGQNQIRTLSLTKPIRIKNYAVTLNGSSGRSLMVDNFVIFQIVIVASTFYRCVMRLSKSSLRAQLSKL